MSIQTNDSAIAKITYHDSGETQFFTDKDAFLKTLLNCLYTLGPNPNMFQTEVLCYDWDLRYQVDCMYLGEFGEDPPEKEKWISEAKDRELQRLIEAESAKPKLDIKVLLDNGVVNGVLINNTAAPVNIEIVSCDDDYEDRDALRAYQDYLIVDKSRSLCNYEVTDLTEANANIPDFESYYRGLVYFGLAETQGTQEYGAEICYLYENKFTRKQFEEDFPIWCHYTELVGEHISYEEYGHLDNTIFGNPMKITKEDDVLINDLKQRLSAFRAEVGEKQTPSLDHMLSNVNARSKDNHGADEPRQEHTQSDFGR